MKKQQHFSINLQTTSGFSRKWVYPIPSRFVEKIGTAFDLGESLESPTGCIQRTGCFKVASRYVNRDITCKLKPSPIISHSKYIDITYKPKPSPINTIVKLELCQLS